MKDTPKELENLRVVVFNDDKTPYAFVLNLLQSVFGKSETDARSVAKVANDTGQAECGTYPPAIAAALVDESRRRIAAGGFPLVVETQSLSGAMGANHEQCGFCGKAQNQTKLLYKGRGVYICDQCILNGAVHLSAGVTQQQFKFAHELLSWHFAGLRKDEIVTSMRSFPERMRADLQVAVEQAFSPGALKLVGIDIEHSYEPLTFAALMKDDRYPKVLAPLQYHDVDIGESTPVPCLHTGLWLRNDGDLAYAVLLSHVQRYTGDAVVQVEIAVPAGERGSELTQRCFNNLEKAVNAAQSYRGKVLSLEQSQQYSGKSTGIAVHRLPTVAREDVVLPEKTLALLDRNILQFAARRAQLKSLGQSAKKGVLLYGPPGTGKTHTIRYLAQNLPGHTTLLVTAEQVGLLGEYFSLARLLQPAMIVIEDADLIARDRESMDSPCEEALLNKLLNEMDGLKEDADVFFVLTTNRPQQLEAALAARPGRIDQAIEFPLPDETGRQKLIKLYSAGMTLPKDLLEETVKKTKGVSAAFIKELMRRTAQNLLDGEGRKTADIDHINAALEEMLFAGGRLNTLLLGGVGSE